MLASLRTTFGVAALGAATLVLAVCSPGLAPDIRLALLAALQTAIVLLTQRALLRRPGEPIQQLTESIKKIAGGDFNHMLKVRSAEAEDVATLAREYNRMLVALAERDKEIEARQKEILQRERLAAVGQLSAEVVHEVRNPLNALRLNIDWLEQEMQSSDPEVRKTLASVSREIDRLHQITDHYLVRARVPLDNQEKTLVNDLVEEVIAFSREEDRSRNIKVEKRLTARDCAIRSDRSRLKQAMLNVLRNAREAMPMGGRLLVETEMKENTFLVRFVDSGYGMNESVRARSFQPFFTTKQNGTGLGLMLTKAIVEEAQGTIHCDSKLGEGTTVTFQFPL